MRRPTLYGRLILLSVLIGPHDYLNALLRSGLGQKLVSVGARLINIFVAPHPTQETKRQMNDEGRLFPSGS